MARRRNQYDDPEVIIEEPPPPSSSSISSYHTAEPQPTSRETSSRESSGFFWSLISSPFYKAEVSTLSLVHLICTLAIGISLSIAVEIEDAKKVTRPKLYYFLVVYMGISILWIFGAFFCGNKSGCCLAQRQHVVHDIPGYLIIGVTFLCIGSSFITAMGFFPFVFSHACNNSSITDRTRNELESEAAFSFTKFVFLILQLYFFCRFSSKRFMDTCSMRMFLMHIIAVNLCTWFYIIVDESVEHKKSSYNIDNCPPFQVMRNITKVIDGVLYPFSIEYSVMSSVLLFLMWYQLKRNDPLPLTQSRQSPENQPPQQQTRWQRFKAWILTNCCKEGMPRGERKPASFWRSAICGYVLGVAMLVFILLIVTVFEVEFTDDQAAAVYFYLGSRITILLLMSFVCLLGLKYLSMHDPGDQSHHTIVDTALIMIGVSGCYLLTGFQITAAANDYRSCDNSTNVTHPATKLSCEFLRVTLADYACGLMQFTLQAFFIVRSLRRCSMVTLPSNAKISSALVVRRCSAFLSIANIGMWAMDTFELKDISEAEVPEVHAYTKDSWRILSHVAFPLCIFFRLHSVFCCFEIVINRFAVELPEDKTHYNPLPHEDGDGFVDARENINDLYGTRTDP